MVLKEFRSLNPKNVRNFSSKLSNNEPTLELLEKGRSNSKKNKICKVRGRKER